MHENLKYTINLDKNIKKYSETSMPDPIEDKYRLADWQAIYSGFDYNTHYLIYAKFIGQKNKQSGEFEVEKTQLYIQNYDGPVTIGFNSKYAEIMNSGYVSDNDPDHDIRLKKRTRFKLGVCLEALKNNSNFECCVEHINPISIKEDDILDVTTLFTPANSTFTNIFNSSNINEAKFVDEKFMKRIGSDIFITDQGKSGIIDLYQLGILNKSQLENAGIPVPKIDSNQIKDKKQFLNKVLRQIEEKKFFGKTFPCIPRGSVFQIK
jgi:hypothetical protein